MQAHWAARNFHRESRGLRPKGAGRGMQLQGSTLLTLNLKPGDRACNTLRILWRSLAGLLWPTKTQRGVCFSWDLNRRRSAPLVCRGILRLRCFPLPSAVDAGQSSCPQPFTGLILGCARVLASCSHAPPWRSIMQPAHCPNQAASSLNKPCSKFANFNEGVAWPQRP